MRREFVGRHGSCLLTKKGRQHRHRPKRTKFANMLSVQHADPGVPKTFSGAFRIYPTYPYLRDTQWAQMRQQGL